MIMIGIIKNWINVLLCLGIFMMIAKLFLPKNKIRKYKIPFCVCPKSKKT